MRRLIIKKGNFQEKGGARWMNTDLVHESCRNTTCDAYWSDTGIHYPATAAWQRAKCPLCGWVALGGTYLTDISSRVGYHLNPSIK